MVLTLVDGDGVITLDPAGGRYALGTTVTATATANGGARFVDFVVDGTSMAHKSGTVITNVKLVAVFAPLGGEGDGAIDEGEGASAEGDGDDEPGSSCARAVAAPADGITLLALLGWVCVGAAGVADVEGVRLTTWSCACRRHG